jgi:hypothetical protein
MRSDTIKAINLAIRESVSSVPNPRAELVGLAVGALHRAMGAATHEEAQRHTLRAIAYLVRRLELDAPTQEIAPNAPTEILDLLEKIRDTERGASSACTVEDAIGVVQEAVDPHWMNKPGQRRRMLRRAAAWALFALELHDAAAKLDAPGDG